MIRIDTLCGRPGLPTTLPAEPFRFVTGPVREFEHQHADH